MLGGLIRRRQAARRLRDRRGAVTVEFMLALTPFLILVLGIIEIGMISFSSATLRNGAYEAARVVRTNSAGCQTQAQIQALICQNTVFAPNCSQQLTATRRVLGGGWTTNAAGLTGGAQTDSNQAAGGDVVVVEARYNWRSVSPLVRGIIGDGNGDLVLSQRFVFEAEPFGTTNCPVNP